MGNRVEIAFEKDTAGKLLILPVGETVQVSLSKRSYFDYYQIRNF